MAKMTLSISLVNGSAFPERELAASDLIDVFVGDDLRPPADGVWFTVYTDDGHIVNISVPVDGKGEMSASVHTSTGDLPQIEPAARTMTQALRLDIIYTLGRPIVVGAYGEPFGGTDEWACGCSATPWPQPCPDKDRDLANMQWMHCKKH